LADEIANQFRRMRISCEDLQPLLVCQAVIGTVDQMVDHRTSMGMTSTGTTSSPLNGREVHRGGVIGAVALLTLTAIVALSWALQRPPTPVPASAPPTAFSAQRAYADLQRIAGPEPTPIGSAGSDAIRDHLVSALSAAGFKVEVQAGVGSQTFQSTTVAGRVDNVVATLPGSDSTGSVILAAHYDSTFGTPGAADDKASVAAMLETARVLASGGPRRNDLVMIFTDGEEAGLLGAASFVAEHPLADRGGVVLNWEATGNAGPSVMFETSSGNAELIKELADSAPYAVGDSALAALYQAGTQNSDFTVFHQAGFDGLNFAFIEGVSAYHHISDTAANLNPAGLQHMGANMLGLARELAERDLAEVRSENDAVFFTAFGQMITYPMWLVWPLAGLGLVIVIALGVLARRRALATTPRLLLGAAAALLPIVVAPLAAIGWWQLLIMIRPGYANLAMGDPYRPELYRWALGALTVTILLAWYLALRRRIGPESMAIGALLWPATLGVVTAWLLPAMSYYGSLSAAAAGVGALIALLIRDRRFGWSVVALTAGAVPGAVLLIMGGITLVGVLGIANGAAGVFFFVLAGLLILPLLELALPTVRRNCVLVLLGAAVVTLLLTGIGLVVDRFDHDHPRQANLLYAMDADTRTAIWASENRRPDPWTARYAHTSNGEAEPPRPLPYGITPNWIGPADVVPMDPPRADLLGSRSDGDNTEVRVRIASSRQADVITLHTDRPVETTTIDVDGLPPVTASPSYPGAAGERTWPYELRFYDPPPNGFTVTMRLRGSAVPQLYVSDYTVGLEQLPGFTPRPPALDRSPYHSSDIVVVGRTLRP
jgi:hypothetical protein